MNARAQKRLSVYVGVAGYLAMVLTGNFMIGVWSKLLAESLRIAFYKETKAPDMVGLSLFFICASIISITHDFLT